MDVVEVEQYIYVPPPLANNTPQNCVIPAVRGCWCTARTGESVRCRWSIDAALSKQVVAALAQCELRYRRSQQRSLSSHVRSSARTNTEVAYDNAKLEKTLQYD